ncbi:MAG TPA: lysylphosphatidylglycerol synthase transmembrane domain-containing protein [Kofleriaceae bacterium]|nr:lysylphosphatidylglycerol synthase transmembrane domain-containing protein [Kofleriaceae bacterium]
MSRPTWARWVTRISLILAVIALIFTVRDIGLRTLGTYFRRIGWGWIAVVVLEVVITTFDAVAIRALTSPEQAKVKLRSTLLAQLAGRAVNAVTPSGNLGEAIKVSVLVDHVSQSRAVSTILLYNIIGISVELLIVGLAAPIMALLVPMPASVRVVMIATCVVCLVLGVLAYQLTRRGVLDGLARFAKRIRLLSAERYARWRDKLIAVDSKMAASSGARPRDRWLGIAAVAASRLTSTALSLVILYAVGESITLGFIAAYTVGGFIVYMVSTLVPMGVGVSEGGNYALFRALGENPARGVTLVLARRVTTILYAAIGLVLMTASETVRRARERQGSKAGAGEPAPRSDVRMVTTPPPSASTPATKLTD